MRWSGVWAGGAGAAGPTRPTGTRDLSGQAGGPGVALEVRIRLDRRPGVPHLSDQAVRTDLPDPRRLVDVLGGTVHCDQSLRRVEGDATSVGRRLHFRDV